MELLGNVAHRCGWNKSVNCFFLRLRKMFVRLSNAVFVPISVDSSRYIFSTKPFLFCENGDFQFPLSHGFEGRIRNKFLVWCASESPLCHRVPYIGKIGSWFKMKWVTANRVIASVHQKFIIRNILVVKKHPCPSVGKLVGSIFFGRPPSIPSSICTPIPFPTEGWVVNTNLTPKRHLGFKSFERVLYKMSVHVKNITMNRFAFQHLFIRREQWGS